MGLYEMSGGVPHVVLARCRVPGGEYNEKRHSLDALDVHVPILNLLWTTQVMRGTPEGRTHSATYNAELQLGNLRWAMIDVLRNPPPGFEEAVRGHFRLLRRRVMATALRWVEQAAAAGEAMQRRMDTAVCELHALLAAL